MCIRDREYFGETFGRPAEVQLPWAAAGQSEEDNVDMFAAEGESLEDVLEFARRCFAHADATITALGADAHGRVAWWPDDKAEVTLAQIIAHVALDEARHAGHADILREQIDGQAGLRAPGNNLPVWGADRWAAHVDRLTAIAEGSGGPGRN